MSQAVLDSSAIIAVIEEEAGADTVRAAIPGGLVSAVNLAEVGSKLIDQGMAADAIRRAIGMFGLEIAALDEDAAYAAALLRDRTRKAGLSLGDRACLALGIARKLPVLTADRSWAGLDLGVEIRLIRDA